MMRRLGGPRVLRAVRELALGGEIWFVGGVGMAHYVSSQPDIYTTHETPPHIMGAKFIPVRIRRGDDMGEVDV